MQLTKSKFVLAARGVQLDNGVIPLLGSPFKEMSKDHADNYKFHSSCGLCNIHNLATPLAHIFNLNNNLLLL